MRYYEACFENHTDLKKAKSNLLQAGYGFESGIGCRVTFILRSEINVLDIFKNVKPLGLYMRLDPNGPATSVPLSDPKSTKSYIIVDMETCRIFKVEAKDLNDLRKKYFQVLCQEDKEYDLEFDDFLDQCVSGDIIVECLDDYKGQDVAQLVDF